MAPLNGWEMSSLDCSVQTRGLSVILGLKQQFTGCKGMMPFIIFPLRVWTRGPGSSLPLIFPFLTSFHPRCLADSHKLPLGARAWSFHPLSSGLAVVLFIQRWVGGEGLPEGVVTPLDSSLDSRSQV